MDTTNNKMLEKALDILEALQQQAEPIGVNELAKLCGLSPATSFRLLQTMKERGWAYQDANEKYSLGSRMFYPTGEAYFYRQLKEVAYYVMCRCTEKEHEAMNLVVREHSRCYILGQTRTERLVDYVPPVGTVLPLHASACGKVLLSELPEPILSEILDMMDFQKMTEHTITDRSVFRRELQHIGKCGYAIDNSESNPQGFCIAVPIRFYQNQMIAALSFSGFIGKKPDTEIRRYTEILMDASETISKKLMCVIHDG